MATLILREPGFVRQTKMSSCWFAALRMLLQWHTGNGTITDPQVAGLASHLKSRSYTDIPHQFRTTNNLRIEANTNFTTTDEIVDFLRANGPFVGGGKVGKLFVGKRIFAHAILIYGVLPDGHILHHDPSLGKHCTIKGQSYLSYQDGERIYYTSNPRVVIVGQGA